jgi:hypothetical protein
LLAAVVRTPFVSTRSLSAIGMPWSAPFQRPRPISSSEARASASAPSAVSVMNALSWRSTASMRRQARARQLDRRYLSRAHELRGFGQAQSRQLLAAFAHVPLRAHEAVR